MKEKTKRAYMASAIAVLIVVVIGLIITIYNRQKEYIQTSENSYNAAFYQLTDYVENVETYLAKSLISTTPEHGAETLTNLWREANLAQTYLSMLPIESQELENTEKFLNQVSDYSYSLSRKNIYNENLSDDDLKNLKDLHQYSEELENSLNQLSDDLNSGRFEWKSLKNNNGQTEIAKQVSNVEENGFTQLEENFHEYSGLIYDGAFSEHITSKEKKGLTGEDISEEEAQKKVSEFFSGFDGKEINNISSLGLSENATIPVYDYSVETTNGDNINMAISKKGGHIVYMNSDREVNSEVISQEDANQKGKEFLKEKGFDNMNETYFLKQDGIVTINYAYTTPNDITVYPDLIKVKVALDNGEVLGIETTGYLNNHTERNLGTSAPEGEQPNANSTPKDVEATGVKISKEEAKKNLNKDLEILSEGLAIIPTEWQTEILCYEFKGKVEDREFLVYINAENGREEDILLITNTPNGTLTL